MPLHSEKKDRRRQQRTHRESSTDDRRATPFSRIISSWQIWLASILIIAGVSYFANRYSQDGPTGEAGPFAGESSSHAQAPSNKESELVAAVQQVYRSARTYRDRTVAYVDRTDGHSIVSELDFAAERPNRIRLIADLRFSQVRLTCDGDRLRVAVGDEATQDFANQFVERPAPEHIRLTNLLSAAEYADISKPHELYSLLMGLPYNLPLTSLGMLLDENSLTSVVERADSVRFMSAALLGDTNCQRLALKLNGGDYVLWIDDTRNVLLRSEQPLPGSDSERIVVEHHDVTIDTTIDPADFVIHPPADSRFVRHFVIPPTGVGRPADSLLNQPVPEMSFVDLNRGRMESSRWQGKIAVLVWFNDHSASQSILQQVNRVAASLSEDDRVYFAAICTEPPTRLGHQDVRNIASRWQIDMAVLRDTEAVGLDVFRMEQAPTLVVLGADGKLQLIEVGANDQLAEQLPIVIDKLLSGENIAADYLKFTRQQRRDYDRYLQLVSLDAPQTLPDQVQAEIAPASQPKRLRMERRWTLEASDLGIDKPGNLLFLPNTQAGGRLLVLDGVSRVVVCEVAGNVLSLHPLTDASDNDTVISHLQQFRSDNRRWFVGTTNLGRQVHVYDAKLQTVLRYPAASRDHAGVQAALLADLDADHQPELYVALAEADGCESISLDGQVQWSNSDMRGVNSITADFVARNAIDERSGHLVVTTDRGTVWRLDAAGQLQREVGVGSRALHRLLTRAPSPAQPTSFCGLAFSPLGGLVAVGFDHWLGERWTYPLPPGAFRSQVREITSAQLFREEEWYWILAGPDGSVHVVSDDGQFHDHFHVGRELRGVSAGRIKGTDWLFIATDTAVSGYVLGIRNDD